MAIDPIENPCERARQLRAKRDEIIIGNGVLEYDSEQGNGVRRRVRYSSADLARLDREIAAAERLCRIQKGQRGARFAATPRGQGW